jgi:hypothetical protein
MGMIKTDIIKNIAVLVAGVIVGAVTSSLLLTGHWYPFLDDHHDLVTDTEYHIHADFLIIVDGQEIDLSKDDFMSIAERILHKGVHLHDNNGKVIHFHAPNITLAEFLSSLKINLTSNCLTVEEVDYCNGDTENLKLYVNNEERTVDLTTYVPEDEDKVLLYYGNEQAPEVTKYLDRITNDACLYSGTCPERGTAPPESCGLFCEL